ncbi:MAG: hypothetical protein AB1461_01435 [Thermodesulfobacteriota bacterium]
MPSTSSLLPEYLSNENTFFVLCDAAEKYELPKRHDPAAEPLFRIQVISGRGDDNFLFQHAGCSGNFTRFCIGFICD